MNLPRCFLPLKFRFDYESSKYAASPKTIDFTFYPFTGAPVLIESKSRIADLIHHLKEITGGCSRGLRTIPVTPPDPAMLFRSCAEKFRPTSPTSMLQGVWIHPGLKHKRSMLESEFSNLPHDKIHFAVLHDLEWNRDAFILAHDDHLRHQVAQFFGLNHVPERACVDDYTPLEVKLRDRPNPTGETGDFTEG